MRSVPPKPSAAGTTGRERPHAVASGVFLALAAAPFALVGVLETLSPLASRVVAFLAAALFASSGLIIFRWPRVGRWLGSAAIVLVAVAVMPSLRASPAGVLLALLLSTVSVAVLWNVGSLFTPRLARRSLPDGQLRGAALSSLALWLVAAWKPQSGSAAALALSFGVVACLAVRWIWTARRVYPRRAVAIAATGAIAAVLTALLPGRGLLSFVGPAVLAVTLLGALPRHAPAYSLGGSRWGFLVGHPERLLVATFATLIAGGTVLLALPMAATSGKSIGLIDAAFTSVSAVCVTGLIVLDTPRDFAPIGQGMLLLLIQMGGLGIMTFSTAAFGLLGGRMSLRHEVAMSRLLSTEDRGSLSRVARRIVVFTFIAEALGVLVLLPAFLAHGDAVGTAVWRALFTSVSAFCNAGFALQSASLVPYQTEPWVLHTVALLIVAGGLSPAAVVAIPALFRRPRRPVPVGDKLGLFAAGILLCGGFVFLLATEWNGAFGQLSFLDRLHNAWFQSATLRTAGFNSVDFSLLHPATLVVMMVFMFVGGSPGGTAGGVKTTTAALLLLLMVQAARGSWELDIFGRRISARSVRKAAVICTLAIGGLIFAFVALLLTQTLQPLDALFEAVSALGTVGLSTGATAQLDEVGKILIMACMFVGRVGTLSILIFLGQAQAPAPLGRPEEEVPIG